MEEKKLTEKESLEVITSMIARTKERYIGNGNILLMWGYLVVVIAILIWLLFATTHNGAWSWLWYAIPLIGGIATPIMSRRQKREFGVTTYSDRVTSILWTIVGISEIVTALLCLGFYLIADARCWGAILSYTLVAVPIAEIAQGIIIKENSMTTGGIIGLAVGIVTICCAAGNIPLHANWYMPLFILSFVAMMIIPGHILNHKASQK